MTTATSAMKESKAQAQPAVAVQAKVRLAYLDTLRAILICLVIGIHAAITYGAQGGWPYIDPNTSEASGILLTLFNGLVQAFALGLYFFIAGYFTPGPYDRKGIGRFWKDRLLRLGIPLLAYMFVINRIPYYFAAVALHDEKRSFWTYFFQTFIVDAEEGPTWFIAALLLFAACYTAWRLATRTTPSEKLAWTRRLPVPDRKTILLFGLAIGVLMFIVGLWSPVNAEIEFLGVFTFMTIFFVQYVLFFVAGTLAYRNDWLARFDSKDLRFWSWLTLGLTAMMPVMFVIGGVITGSPDLFLGGLYWQAAAFMLWVGIFSVSISMMLILWLRGKNHGRLMQFAGANSYGVYLIHQPVLVPLSVAFAAVMLDPLLKFVIVLPLAIALSFLISAGLRRIPGVKAIL